MNKNGIPVFNSTLTPDHKMTADGLVRKVVSQSSTNNNVHHQNFISQQALMKCAPCIQITYKNAFIPEPAKAPPRYILPKPLKLPNKTLDDYNRPLKALASLSPDQEALHVQPPESCTPSFGDNMQIKLPSINNKSTSFLESKLRMSQNILPNGNYSEIIKKDVILAAPEPCDNASLLEKHHSDNVILKSQSEHYHSLNILENALNAFAQTENSEITTFDCHSMNEIQPCKIVMENGANENHLFDSKMEIDPLPNGNDVDFEKIDCNPSMMDSFTQQIEPSIVNIIDVSPELCPSSGGKKVIIIGSWNAKNARYECRFGTQTVAAEQIQNGVLRCYSPAHEPGKVKLCVLCNSVVISNEVNFEFVPPTELNQTNHSSWMAISDRSLTHLLIERLAAIAGLMGQDDIVEVILNVENSSDQVENVLVDACKKLMEVKVEFEFEYNVENKMTVLHLASALGFMKLIQLLMNWVETNANKLLNTEACTTQTDQFQLIPLMWSAAKGHFNSTCVLQLWNEETIQATDKCGCTAIDLAREAKHTSLVEYLERLKKKAKNNRDRNDSSCLSGVAGSSLEQEGGVKTLGKTLAYIQSIISENEQDFDVFDQFAATIASSVETSNPTSPFMSQSSPFSQTTPFMSQSSPFSQTTPVASPFSGQTKETAEFCEFFFKTKKIEKDFEELTLTGAEQKELYTAANVIQTAYKTYKDRRERRDHELYAAILIQSYYRRYKQYAAFKKMQKGAVLIQNQYRAHREKSRRKYQAASTIQSYYRRYRERKNRQQHTSQQQDCPYAMQARLSRSVMESHQ